MSYNKDKPYNDLPLLLPDTSYWEKINIYKKLAEARAALAELKGRLSIIPNPLMLINTLVLQEAKDSSTIENIFTTNEKLYKAFLSDKFSTDPATKEVLQYRDALWNSYKKLKNRNDFSKQMVINIFKIITQKNEGIRTGLVYIGNQYNVIYTPPEPGNILENKLKNWFDIALNQNNLEPLIKMAILHYQFEAIHPFSDGNGRTGRILNAIFLCLENLIDLPVLYMSKYILENKNEYYRLLKEVTESNNWEDWILYILDAVKHTSIFTLKKVNAIYDIYLKTIDKVKSEAKEIYSHELINVLFNQPYCKISILKEMKIASRNTASKYLKKLEKIGILSSGKIGREVLYKNLALYDILSSGQ